ncbi:MAG: PQQ-dependent sugar dehydrogenase [candidate division KSB1 bacterium]|nr:PQQ-dependent sugar dehydrogenase [candidate division KSB1 bacterium]MDZ7366720.1 PQQ-dependent sugar dehydrogenase [candidate division KSB1 bacterium]MDZ7404733.1 PQQ-dependent sugar dehydrogenase [candidate division KSB1 bacterium]
MWFRVNWFFAIFLICPAAYSQSQLQLQNAFPNLTFSRPVDLQHPGDGTDRLFVVEQAGVIRVFDNHAGATVAPIFLDIRSRVNDSDNEEGLLGLAFHPDYKNNGYFYVNYTANPPRRTVIARYRVTSNPNQADPNSEFIVLQFEQPFSNHNGGQLAFGPDGYLYIATGDGGSGGDPNNNGQSLQTLLGKILRLDVNNPSGGRNYGIPSDNPFVGTGNREEIFAYGLRNPWRMSFDPVTQWLWAGDVGQNRFEEIDLIEKGKNYGWRIMEGNACFNPSSGCNTAGLVRPVWEYGRSLGISVTGGHVYRGSGVPQLVGAYIYGDFGSGRIWALRYDGVNPPVNTELMDTNLGISSFGVDKNFELYICAFDSRIYRFRPTTTAVAAAGNVPKSAQLAQNYPNPFGQDAFSLALGNPTTVIEYTLTQNVSVELCIYNVQGQLVRTLVRQDQSAGKQIIRWDGRDDTGQALPSGAYLYRLKIGNEFVKTKRLLLVK